jgi:hypothetical protein
MSGLTNALQELRAERTRAHLDRAIAVMELLNGRRTSSTTRSSETSHKATQPVRVISAASRRKMALGQKARWAKAKNGAQPGTVEKKTAASPAKQRIETGLIAQF